MNRRLCDDAAYCGVLYMNRGLNSPARHFLAFHTFQTPLVMPYQWMAIANHEMKPVATLVTQRTRHRFLYTHALSGGHWMSPPVGDCCLRRIRVTNMRLEASCLISLKPSSERHFRKGPKSRSCPPLSLASENLLRTCGNRKAGACSRFPKVLPHEESLIFTSSH